MAKKDLKLVSGGSMRSKVQVSRRTEGLVTRDIVRALQDLKRDNCEYAEGNIQPGVTIGCWVKSVEDLRSGVCQSLVELANHCEDLAGEIGEYGGESVSCETVDRLMQSVSVLLVNSASQFGQLDGLLRAKPKG